MRKRCALLLLATALATAGCAQMDLISSQSGLPPVAIETYARVFEEERALDKLEAFASLNGARHYRLPPNEERITLEKSLWTALPEVKVEGPDERALIYRGGETIEWKVVASAN